MTTIATNPDDEQISPDPEELTKAIIKQLMEEKEKKRLKHNQYMRNYYKTKKGKEAMQRAQKKWYKPHGQRGRPEKKTDDNIDGK